MAKSATALVVTMRVMGGSMMFSIIAVFMPDAWLEAAVKQVEHGVPVGPLVEYMARGWSAFYFMLGGLIWLFSTDLPRYLPATRWLSWCYVLSNGAFLFVIGWLWAIFRVTAKIKACAAGRFDGESSPQRIVGGENRPL